jgi:RND family efflux transporter MFP subunit
MTTSSFLRAVCVGACLIVLPAAAGTAFAQGKELSERAKNLDANGNGVIDRDEARGPMQANFDAMDCDRSGSLDGAEIRGFFTGAGCPAGAAAPPSGQSANASSGRPARPPRPVSVDAVVEQEVSQTVPVIGRLVAREAGVVAAQINGAVTEVRVNVGDRLKKGDPIAVLAQERLRAERDRVAAQAERYRAMVVSAEAQLEKRRQELQRMTDLQKSAAFSRARYEDLQRDVATQRAALMEREAQQAEAQAQLRAAEIDLRDSVIRAPFPGIVTEKHIDVGAYVTVGRQIVSMINDAEIEIEAEVPTSRLRGLDVGAPVSFRLDTGSVHPATIRAIVPKENLRTRTRPVRFTPDFGERAQSLAADQSVTVHIPAGGVKTALTVHKDAIVRRADAAFVYVVADGRASRRTVSVGEGVGNRFVVLNGLAAGDTVVVRGNETLGLGGPVNVVGGAAANARSEGGAR